MDKIHIGMKDLHPAVYLCSETQERFMWVCSPETTQMILDHYNILYDLPKVSKGAKASVVGRIRDDGLFIIHNGNHEIANAPAAEVTKGFLYDRPVKNPNNLYSEPDLSQETSLNEVLLRILSHENIASREPVYEKYDKQVQGRVYTETGTADAGVMSPFNSIDYPEEIRNVGIALSTDHNPRYSLISPYWGGVNAVVEAMRNIAAVGATPHALTDCLCFGNPEKPYQMWEFVDAVKGISDASNAITLKNNNSHPTPIIAGNVSFYNESKNGSIPPSPIVSCLGRINNVNKSLGMNFQSKNSFIYLIGERKDELGGSAYYNLYDELGANVPKPDLEKVKNQIYALTDCIDSELILSCHDISDGGISCAIAEMTFANSIGCKVEIGGELPAETKLFSETGGFIIEVYKKNVTNLVRQFKKYGIDIIEIGSTNGTNTVIINNYINQSIDDLRNAWENGLRDKL
jgi:phosphoribosylformylglycinamidine synthase